LCFLDEKGIDLMKNDVLYRIFTVKRDKTRMFYVKTEKMLFEGAGYMVVSAPVVFKEK